MNFEIFSDERDCQGTIKRLVQKAQGIFTRERKYQVDLGYVPSSSWFCIISECTVPSLNKAKVFFWWQQSTLKTVFTQNNLTMLL